jgi:hypothetical protein
MSWTNRVRHSPGTPPLRQVQEAAENLADQAGIAPGRARVVFQTVADVPIITAAAIGGVLGAIHLWKTLFPKHKQNQPTPEAAGGGNAPPRRRDPHAIASGDDRGGYKDSGYRPLHLQGR